LIYCQTDIFGIVRCADNVGNYWHFDMVLCRSTVILLYFV